MRAMVIDGFGGPEVLHEGEIERPSALPGQVVVKVAYAGVNPADWKAREGWLARYFDYRFPFVVGFDAAGTIAEVGEGVDDLRVGDRVVTASNQGRGERGSYAEYVASDRERVVRLPPQIGFAEAASMPTAGMTAWEAVVEQGEVRPGARVVVHGGSGGTGSFAIQIARMMGARVAATCGPASLDYVRALGAELAVDYRRGRVAEELRAWAPEGVDLVVDTVGQGTFLEAVDLVRPGGVIAPIGTLIADEPAHGGPEAATRGVHVRPTVSTFANQPRQLAALVEAMVAGRIRAPEISEMALTEAAEAQRRVADGHVRGKIVLRVG
ncbi:NADP-dependent oxidoreductase [Sphingomonas jatrophae]|nr:NADP-dependent oxidoreductase [Sphingomonas jatrophae]